MIVITADKISNTSLSSSSTQSAFEGLDDLDILLVIALGHPPTHPLSYPIRARPTVLSAGLLNPASPDPSQDSGNSLSSASCSFSRLEQDHRSEEDTLQTPGRTCMGGIGSLGR